MSKPQAPPPPPQISAIPLTISRWPSLPASSNTAFIHPTVKERLPPCTHVVIRDNFILPVDVTDQLRPDQIALGMVQRKWATLPENQQFIVQPYTPKTMIESVVFVVDFFAAPRKVTLEGKKALESIKALWDRHCISEGQPLFLEVDQIGFTLTATQVKTIDLGDVMGEKDAIRAALRTGPAALPLHGILTPNTSISLHKNPDAQLLTLKNAGVGSKETIIKEGFKFENMGIGGLDNEFATILRRAFATRYYPAELIQRMGIKHVRGILLYGPPGTGKTLLARQIGKMLNSHEPKVVSGPEILNKFVGESEKNMRDLFKEAEEEYKEKADDSDLHLIIFDEIDAICKSRGTYSGGTGVGDSVVNQLLAKMDGVDSLNNILVIGMTNRKDLIDDALLRPGRLEVHMEIGLPDEQGRQQILRIHTSKLRESNCLTEDVNLEEIAHETRNYSGAELEGVVKAAVSHALFQRMDVKSLGRALTPEMLRDIRVTMSDFRLALNEVTPLYGVDREQAPQFLPFGIIPYGPSFDQVVRAGQAVIRMFHTAPTAMTYSVLLEGEHGVGKTAIAAMLAKESEFPFHKIITPKDITARAAGDSGKVQLLNKMFDDAFKSRMSMLVLDDFEKLIELSAGPRFSNAILQCLQAWLAFSPPSGRKLLIIATTSCYEKLRSLEMTDCFNEVIHVPCLKTSAEVEAVLTSQRCLNTEDCRRFSHELSSAGQIPIKRLLHLVRRASGEKSEPQGALLTYDEINTQLQYARDAVIVNHFLPEATSTAMPPL